MLTEDPQNPYNPNAKVNPKRKQRNLLTPDDKARIKTLKRSRLKDKLRNRSLSLADQGAQMFVTPSIVGKFIERDVVRSVEKREKKLNKQQRIHEGKWDAIKKTVKSINTGASKRLGQYTDWVQKNPIKAGSIAIGGHIAAQSAIGIGSHYISHRAKMKDPNYAAQTYDLARQRKNRTGVFTPLDQEPIYPSHGDYEQATAQKQRMQPGKPENATPNEEPHPASKFSNQAAQSGHKPEHAHMAVTRSMAMDKVNMAGKDFKLNQNTKTGTRKEDCMSVDSVMEMVDRLDEFDVSNAVNAVQKHWKTFKPQATKAWGTLKKEGKATWDRAKPHLQKAYGDIKSSWNKRNMKGPVGEKFRQNKRASGIRHAQNAWDAARGRNVAEHIADYNVDNIYEYVQAALAIARPALAAAGKFLGKGIVKKVATDAAISGGLSYVGSKLSRPKNEEFVSDLVVDAADNLYEVGWAAGARVLARKTAQAGVIGVGGGVGSMVGQRIGSIGMKKQQQEEIGYGGRTDYEINPAKNYKAARALKTNNWYDAVANSRKTAPRNFNKPKYSANPQMKYEHLGEASVTNADSVIANVDKIGAHVGKLGGEAIKGVAKGAGKALGGYRKWLETGNTKTQLKKIGITAAAAYGARKLWKSRSTNKKYQQKQAEKHREGYNKAAANLDYTNARDEFRQRRTQHYRGY